MNEIIHFAHGNGFPSLCYRQMLMPLNQEITCYYVKQVGHNRDFPVTENWHYLVAEVINSITTKTSKPVIGLGHSLGGVLTLLAAIEKPDLFRAIILLDSPLVGRFKSELVRLSKALGIIDHLTPAYRTRMRRRHWSTREQVWDYLKHKRLFRYFTDACLNDYIDYGLKKDESGYSLRFEREIEYQIYRTLPHTLYQYEKKLQVPTALIYGRKSSVLDRFDLKNMQQQYDIMCYEMNGTHMFPMEYPEKTAELILNIIKNTKLR